ncbi:hypothetical protein FV395_23335 [Salmonella enterica]|nr:hypothetical protein [Salmonella enterica]EEO4608493.1 hypothetical protein [Salmonella enterica]EGP0845491.1 hypothetical protein [Salmonella enterica]EGP0863703.1 hypothetical protein [Salmonella enterica]
MIIKEFKNPGEPTRCASLQFMTDARNKLPLYQHTTAEELQARMKADFEKHPRFEYLVTDDAGRDVAIMVIVSDQCDIDLGQPTLQPLIACSLEDGKGHLTAAYRWLFDLAKVYGVNWLILTKTEGHRKTFDYRQIKKSK